MSDKCAVKGCKSQDIGIDYLGKPVCNRCWNRLAEKPVNKIRAAVGLSLLEVPDDASVVREIDVVSEPEPESGGVE